MCKYLSSVYIYGQQDPKKSRIMPGEPDNRTVSVHHGYLVSRVHNREESIQLSYTVSKMSLLSTVALSKNVLNRLIKQVDDEHTHTHKRSQHQKITSSRCQLTSLTLI